MATKRIKKGGGVKLEKSDVPYPKGIHGENYEKYTASGFAARIPEGTEITPNTSEQEFEIDEDKVTWLYFDRPGRDLPKKRLYNIKGIHEDGRLVQVPFVRTVMNNAAGDPNDAIGLRRAERKGITLLLHDWETLRPIYCGAWDCWAKAVEEGNFVGFCTLRHAQHTVPNTFKGKDDVTLGIMESGVTTRQTWGL